MATASQLAAMKAVRDKITSGQGASLNARQPITFGNTLNKTVTSPAATQSFDFNQTIPTIPKTNINFGLPGITTQKAALPQGSSVGPGATVGIPDLMLAKPPSQMSTIVTPQGRSGSSANIKSAVVDIPTSNFSVGQSAAFVAPQGVSSQQTVSSNRLDNGLWNPNYVPGSESEAFQSGVDAYTRQKWLENYYKSKDIPFTANMPSSFEDEAKQFLTDQESEKSLLDNQIQGAIASAQGKADSQKAGIDVSLTPSREGVYSISNIAAKETIKGQYQNSVTELKMNLDQKKADLKKLQSEQQKQFLTGREDQIRNQLIAVANAEEAVTAAEEKQRQSSLAIIRLLQKDNALASLDPESLAFLQEGLPGVPDGIIQALSIAASRNVETDKLASLNTATDMFSKMVKSGAEIPQEFLQSTADAIGVDVGALLGVAHEYNQEVQRIKEDDMIDTQTKAIALQQAEQNLSDQLSGFSTPAGKNLQTLIKLYESGANQTAISAFKELAGITDYEDPLTKVKLNGTVLDQAVKLSDLTGSIHMPGPNGGFVDTRIPTFDAAKFSSTEQRDLMRISLQSDSNRRLLANNLLEQYGASASPYAEQILGLPIGSLDGFQTIAEKTQAINMIGKAADTQKWLEDNGYAEHNDALFQNYLDELGAGKIKPGGIGVDPMTLPDVRKVILDNSSVTQSFHAPNTGGSDKGGGHGGIDTVFKDGYVHALRGGTVVQIIPWDGKNPYGNRVIIQDKQGLLWQYSHMGNRTKGGDPFIVKPGDIVSPMEEIGIQGNTGRVYSNKSKSDPTYGVHTDIRIVGGGAKKAGTTEVTLTKATPPKGGIDRIAYNLKEHGKVFSIDTVEELKDAIFKEFGDEPTKEEMRLFQKYGELGLQKIRENRNAKKKKSTGIDASSITLAPENV